MKLTDNQVLQQKPSLTQKQSPRRLWLSFIITLFIFASSVSAYFLVKNSQDIRRSAAEPYNSQCTCLYVSDCSVAGMKPCEGSCSPACSGPTSCCQAITSDLCTKGERYCVNNNSLAVCKSDRSGYTITACAAGKACDPTTTSCITQATPTTPPNPTNSPNCAATNQSCQSKACCNSSDVCETVYGGKFCVAKGTECTSGQQKCAQEGSASYVYKCTSGGYWQRDKACDFGCSGNACKSACTPGAKRCSGNAIETCNSSGAAWSKQSCPSNSSCNNQTLTCINTSPTCQGTCYTNSSCTAIGKAPATGTCINETSVCCKELSEQMIPCGLSQTLCKRENCVVMPGTVSQFCSESTQSEVAEQYVEGVWEGTKVVGGTAATIAVSFIPVVGPVVQIASAATQGLVAYYTCSELAEIRNEPSIDQEIKDQFSRACITSSISAATGFIGGGSSLVSQVVGPTLSATSQLTLTGLGMVDNFGNLAVSSMNANNICKVYGTSSYECYAALANAGISIGSTALGVYQFSNVSRQVQIYNQQVQTYNQLDKIIADNQDLLSQSGVVTRYHLDRSDPYLAEHPSVIGYYNPLAGTINVIDDDYYYYSAMIHEQIHAIRDVTGANANLWNFTDQIDSPNYLAKKQIESALEEVGTITANLEIFDSIDGFTNTYPFNTMYEGQQKYLQKNVQQYLEALKHLDPSYPSGEIIHPGKSPPGLSVLYLPDGSIKWIFP